MTGSGTVPQQKRPGSATPPPWLCKNSCNLKNQKRGQASPFDFLNLKFLRDERGLFSKSPLSGVRGGATTFSLRWFGAKPRLSSPSRGSGRSPDSFALPGVRGGATTLSPSRWFGAKPRLFLPPGVWGEAPTLFPSRWFGAEPRLLFLLRYRRPDAVDCRGDDKIDAEFREEIDSGAQNHNEIYNTDARTDIQNIFLKR